MLLSCISLLQLNDFHSTSGRPNCLDQARLGVSARIWNVLLALVGIVGGSSGLLCILSWWLFDDNVVVVRRLVLLLMTGSLNTLLCHD